MDRFQPRPFVSLLLASATLFYLPLGMRALWDSDEGRYAEIAREMLELKDWIVPHLNYRVYFDNPPLMYWLTALSMSVLGQTAFAARFWCATFGLLTIGVVYSFGKSWKNERVGLLAGGILATSLGFFSFTQYLVLDMAFTFWTSLTLFAGAGLLVDRSASRARRLSYVAAFGVAGGILTKGLEALILPLTAWLAVYLSHTRRYSLPKKPWKAAFLLCGMLTLPWFFLVSVQHPIFPYWFFIREPVLRYFTTLQGYEQPFYFYVPVVLGGFLPWAVFLPKVAASWLAHRHAALQRDSEGALLVTWICLVFFFFSASHSKLASYVLPIFPALALLTANEFDEALEGNGESSAGARAVREGSMPPWVGRGLAALILLFFASLLILKLPPDVLSIASPEWKSFVGQSGILALVLGAGVFVLVGVWGMRQIGACVGGVMLTQVLVLTSGASLAPELDPYQSTRLIAERFQSRARSDEPIVAYGVSYEDKLQSLPFYLGRRIPVFGPPGELKAMLAMPAGTWGITDQKNWQSLRQNAPPDTFQSMGQTGHLLLFRKERS